MGSWGELEDDHGELDKGFGYMEFLLSTGRLLFRRFWCYSFLPPFIRFARCLLAFFRINTSLSWIRYLNIDIKLLQFLLMRNWAPLSHGKRLPGCLWMKMLVQGVRIAITVKINLPKPWISSENCISKFMFCTCRWRLKFRKLPSAAGEEPCPLGKLTFGFDNPNNFVFVDRCFTEIQGLKKGKKSEIRLVFPHWRSLANEKSKCLACGMTPIIERKSRKEVR